MYICLEFSPDLDWTANNSSLLYRPERFTRNRN